MNVRIKNNEIRFKISRDELESLCAGRIAQQKTPLFSSGALMIKIRTNTLPNAPLRLSAKPSLWDLSIDKNAAIALLKSLPSREGLTAVQTFQDGATLNLSLVVDIRAQRPKTRKHA